MTCKNFLIVEVDNGRGFYHCRRFQLRITTEFCDVACKVKEEKEAK